ncbi:MAG: hypothetical protein U0289_11605 [Cyclobacteriaceae bacterium]|nr:hypothetical protein [Cytophagales bacterium]HNP76979.1 hypothetical protein [Cyclobacteriaceae bacterium]
MRILLLGCIFLIRANLGYCQEHLSGLARMNWLASSNKWQTGTLDNIGKSVNVIDTVYVLPATIDCFVRLTYSTLQKDTISGKSSEKYINAIVAQELSGKKFKKIETLEEEKIITCRAVADRILRDLKFTDLDNYNILKYSKGDLNRIITEGGLSDIIPKGNWILMPVIRWYRTKDNFDPEARRNYFNGDFAWVGSVSLQVFFVLVDLRSGEVVYFKYYHWSVVGDNFPFDSAIARKIMKKGIRPLQRYFGR